MNTFEAGFEVTALADLGLTLDLVAQIPLGMTADVKDDGDKSHTVKYAAAPKFGLIAQFEAGDISVNGGIGAALGYANDIPAELLGEEDEEHGVVVNFSVEPVLKIGESITVGADIGVQYNADQAKEDAAMGFGLGAFVKYSVGGAALKTGLGVLIDALNEPGEVKSTFTLKIPLTVTVGF